MKLTFFGAAKAVTGSCHCLEVGGKKILIDCGLQQGRDERDNRLLDFSPAHIDYVVVTHAPPEGVGDGEDVAHRGFRALLKLLDKYKPRYLLHGHTHINYSHNAVRERQYGETQVINVCQKYELEIPDDTIKPTHKKGDLKYLNY